MRRGIQLLAIMVLTFIFSSLAVQAENYYMSPGGSDSNDGRTTVQAWATLEYSESILGAGDTLFIMGGVYSNSQRFERYGGSGGTSGNPLVFKAYGDDIAVFQYTNGGGRHSNRYWSFFDGADHVVIDGFSYLNPSDSLYIKLEGREDASFVILFIGESDGSNWTEHITIRGIEIDGNFQPSGAAYTIGGEMRYAIGFDFGRIDTIQSCYISNVYHPTGDIYPGDGTDRAQGTGEAIYLESCERIYIADNVFYNANHAIMSVHQHVYGNPSRYIKISNNYCTNYWGGGIYLSDNTNYTLVEKNIIMHVGETTTKTKGAFFVGGNRNVFRKNVSYTPMHSAIGLKSQGFADQCRLSDSSLVYNNTFFGSAGNTIELASRNEGLWSCADASATYNRLANNIIYKSTGETPDIPFHSEIKLWLFDASVTHNWIEPDVSGTSPSTTNFGHNRFFNNCIRKDNHSSYQNELIGYKEDQDLCGESCNLSWSLSEIESLDPIAWYNNIEDDPLLISEDPDAYKNIWWHLSNGSPCIDRGAVVYDEIGEYVNLLYPGYGWGNINYRGAAPDIGAFEFSGENPAPVNPPVLNPLRGK